jgi:hypothetical protein
LSHRTFFSFAYKKHFAIQSALTYTLRNNSKRFEEIQIKAWRGKAYLIIYLLDFFVGARRTHI